MTDQFREETDRVVAGLGRVTEALTKIADAAEALKEEGRRDQALSPAHLGYALYQIREMHELLDKQVKRVYHVKDALDKSVLPERMRAAGIDGFKLPEVARSFSIIEKTSASFVDKEAGLEWLRKIGQGDMVQETVNAGTLAAFCRNLLLEQGIEPPADVVKLSTYSTMSMVKYRPKG